MPWCPKCKSEYREGFAQCSDCLCDLIENFPEENEKACLTNDVVFDETNAKKKTRKRAKVIIPSQYHQSLINVTAFLIVYIKCCDIIQDVLTKIDMLYYDYSIAIAIFSFLLPAVFNLIYFMGSYAILNHVSIRKYLTPKNILINISLFSIYEIIIYVYSNILSNLQITSGIYYLGRVVNIHMLLKILLLVTTYILTIQKVSLKRILFTKMALCFYLFMILLTVVQGLYHYYFSSGMTIMTDYSMPIIQLYLLWFSVTTSKECEEL